MSEGREAVTEPPRRSWAVWVSIAIGSTLVFGAVMGFLIVPAVQGSLTGVGAWTAICRAVGAAPGSPSLQQPRSQASPQPVSQVSWSPKIIDALGDADRTGGQQIASEMCAPCHGAAGISTDPQYPNLSGQSIFAIYKQLHDFKSGARQSELMTAIAQQLSEEQMTNVSGYYSQFPRGTLDAQLARGASEDTRALIERGNTARGLPACNACHGAFSGGPVETPTLTGQVSGYLERQLQTFSSGGRKNDVWRRMRSIAEKLSPEEMKALAAYYASAKLAGGESAH